MGKEGCGRKIQKLIWCSTNGRDKNQIDHLVISWTWRTSLRDLSVRGGADVGNDHHLVTATLKLKLRRNGPGKARQRHFDVKKLKDPRAKSTFTLQLKNKFQALADTEKHAPPSTSDINTKWEHIRVAYTQTIEACLGHRRGGSGSQQIPGKPSRAGESWRRKSWTPDQRDWKRDTGSSTEKQIGRWRGWKGLTSRPTWNMWQVKQKRPTTGENKGRLYKITKLINGKYCGANVASSRR